MSRPVINRAYARVGERLVHYRYAGNGPPVLLIHQSPRSSLENIPILEAWADRFTVIAPDTPGFGESTPLAMERPEVPDYADALIAFMDEMGLAKAGLYGMHSGAIIGAGVAKVHPERLTALACNGYGFWSKEEQRAFGENYLPPFLPSGFGEHLVWLWSRLREQLFFFPWYETNEAHRLRLPEPSADYIHSSALDLLASGDSYRRGYGAVFRADRAVPGADRSIPTLVAACDTDPLQAHIDRLGDLPPQWQTQKIRTMDGVIEACRDFLSGHTAEPYHLVPAQGLPKAFTRVETATWSGLIHSQRRGPAPASHIALAGPGSSAAAMLERQLDKTHYPSICAFDLPGHGQSDRWNGGSLDELASVMAAAIAAAGGSEQTLVTDGLTAPLGFMVAARAPQVAGIEVIEAVRPAAHMLDSWRREYVPDSTLAVDGTHLVRSWRFARESLFFWPWFRSGIGFARSFDPAHLEPARLAVVHRAMVLAHDAQPVLDRLLDADASALARSVDKPITCHLPEWSANRDDLTRLDAGE